ncbi:hypothetical protein Q1W71_13600 [Flavobacterium pectinovorum]|uniref:hypothetical protein n=1 Tax=Flavobacterium pectinovorum TaxID=29533 RepID=UPI00265EEA00|nr:hypothetical protein [Flavobacterium pectinovorum]WKL45993.1 hypothetical protein Q1W71_13600 [Flavobacterium pectinovorum]
MELAQFAQIVLDDFVLYIIVFIAFFLLYRFFFLKNTFVNIIDSFLIEAITSAGSATTIFVMWYNNSIQNKFLFSFITTELAIFLGINFFFIFKKKTTTKTQSLFFNDFQKKYFYFFFYVTSVFFVLVQLIIFKTIGVTLLSTEEGINHVNAFDGLGVFFDVSLVIKPIFATVLFMKRKIFNRFTTIDYFLIFFLILSSIASGSKSSFMVLFTCYAFVEYKFATLENKEVKKIPKKYLIIFFSSILFIITIGSFGGGDISAVTKLFERVLFSGDIFLLGYNDEAIRYVTMDNKNAFSFIFYPFYGKFLKLIGIDLTPTNIGVGLYDFTYGITSSGSTPRHNYLSLLFFGEKFGWILSLLIGLFIGFIRFVIYEFKSVKSVTFNIFIILVASITPFCITDIYLFNMMLFMIIILFLLIVIISFLLMIFFSFTDLIETNNG